ncbi:MAG: glycosyltransferase family 1 protein, partial [Opitutaceae bacterium]|nr:glycosyltransferase family 1 protein [Opitutaceae bacterium]
MRILFSTCSAAGYMAPPRLADEQIVCGPDWLDADIGGYVTARNTPVGEYDLAAIAARLPADQQPEAVVCLVDASWRSVPRNLQAFRCPKVLLVADTHHLNAPLAGMIRYAQSERFDRVVLLYDRHHWDFFAAAGVKPLYWFPGLTFPHDDRTVASARPAAARESRIAFVGQTGICHPRRIQLLSQLNAQNLPLQVRAVSQREGLGFYGSSTVGFNSSLNGDLNLRVFEIMASGAMLLTDALAPASGLTDVWQPGRELVTYASAAELVEKARHAIAQPAEAAAIGAGGARWFDENFSAARRQAAFERLVSDGQAPAMFAQPGPAADAPRPAVIAPRLVSGYEYVQELHRNLDRVTVQ